MVGYACVLKGVHRLIFHSEVELLPLAGLGDPGPQEEGGVDDLSCCVLNQLSGSLCPLHLIGCRLERQLPHVDVSVVGHIIVHLGDLLHFQVRFTRSHLRHHHGTGAHSAPGGRRWPHSAYGNLSLVLLPLADLGDPGPQEESGTDALHPLHLPHLLRSRWRHLLLVQCRIQGIELSLRRSIDHREGSDHSSIALTGRRSRFISFVAAFVAAYTVAAVLFTLNLINICCRIDGGSLIHSNNSRGICDVALIGICCRVGGSSLLGSVR